MHFEITLQGLRKIVSSSDFLNKLTTLVLWLDTKYRNDCFDIIQTNIATDAI